MGFGRIGRGFGGGRSIQGGMTPMGPSFGGMPGGPPVPSTGPGGGPGGRLSQVGGGPDPYADQRVAAAAANQEYHSPEEWQARWAQEAQNRVAPPLAPKKKGIEFPLPTPMNGMPRPR